MNFYDFQIVLQEVPGEISLCFFITGCPLQCEGCHSPVLWKATSGDPLDPNNYKSILEKYLGYASCVLFMGGEWHAEKLIQNLLLAQTMGYKTCLYTGLEEVSEEIKQHLNYLKTGPWIPSKGGLDRITTNQVFTHLDTQNTLNHLFLKN